MAQHLWFEARRVRFCEVCKASQGELDGHWAPSVSPICSGDDDDDGRRVVRPRPNAPSGAPRVLEMA